MIIHILSDKISGVSLEYIERIGHYCKIYGGAGNFDFKKFADGFDAQKDVLICVVSEGKSELSSEDFAAKIKGFLVAGVKNLYFTIEGIYADKLDRILGGAGSKNHNAANVNNGPLKKIEVEKISFSSVKVSEKMLSAMLAEQIYRAFKIINNETYHK